MPQSPSFPLSFVLHPRFSKDGHCVEQPATDDDMTQDMTQDVTQDSTGRMTADRNSGRHRTKTGQDRTNEDTQPPQPRTKQDD